MRQIKRQSVEHLAKEDTPARAPTLLDDYGDASGFSRHSRQTEFVEDVDGPPCDKCGSLKRPVSLRPGFGGMRLCGRCARRLGA